MIKLMIVDDEIVIAMALRKRLQQLGYRITAVTSSGVEAIKKAAEEKPDIVLMDINICGEIDGIETAKRIKSNADVHIAFLTGYPDEDLMEEAKVVKPIGYFIKPVECEELQQVFDSAMHIRESDSIV